MSTFYERKQAKKRAALKRRAKHAGATIVRVCTTVLIALVALSLASQLVLNLVWSPTALPTAIAHPPTAEEQLETRSQLRRLESNLEAYRAQFGDYPESLEQLVEQGWFAADALTYPRFSASYFYLPSGDSYALYAPKF